MTDLFDAPAQNVKVERDHMGRPRIKQPDGSTEVYTRCTTYVGCIEDQYQVQRWRNRMVAVGLADRPDLLLQVAAHRAPEDKQDLNLIVDQAAEAGKASAAANIGTALHKLTEKLDKGEELGRIPDAYQADVEAFRTVCARVGLKAWLIEPFTVMDELKVAGTPDRVYELPGLGFPIGDTKTGSIEYSPLKFAMQMAMYAHSRMYQVATGERSNYPIPGTVNLSRAVVLHLPQGTGTCELFSVDIEQGWEAVAVATSVREWRNRGKKLITKLDQTTLSSDESHELARQEKVTLFHRAIEAIKVAPDVQAVRNIWGYAVNGCHLNEQMITTLCLARLAELEGSQR